MKPIIARKEAVALNLPRYFTGNFCINGHLSERLTKSKDCVDCKRDWRRRNFLSEQIRKKKYAEDNRDTVLKRSSDWGRNNRGRATAKGAKYRATKLKATPSWSESELIRRFYEDCPEGHHVDHIIPLQGKEVCGLHVLTNLQYLLARENISKGNRMVAAFL